MAKQRQDESLTADTAKASDPGNIRYQPDEQPPPTVALGLGLQSAVLIIARIVVVPMFVVRAAGGTEAYLSWALFATVSVSGVTTALQALRLGRIGSGYVAVMGTSLATVGVAITAVAEGGPALLATLGVVTSLVPLVLSARLALFRRVLTPTVSGTVIMLIPATLMPSAFGLLKDVPSGTPPAAAPIIAISTLAVIVVINLKGSAEVRLWSPVVGVVAGSLVAAMFGLYDVSSVANASWFGIPAAAWPGLDLDFGPLFWGLLPAFVFVSLIASVQTISNAVGTQRVSWRRPRAVDYRAVQRTVATAGVGNLLCGLAGTVPNTLLTTSVAVTDLTGAAARAVGIAVGAVFVAMALLPKALAVVLAIPGPVVAAYLVVLMAAILLLGMKMVLQEGIDYRHGLIAGVAFWLGVGFQYGAIFPEFAQEFAGGLLRSGVTAGGLVAILMTVLMEVTGPRRRRIETALDVSALPKIREFLAEFASRGHWDEKMARRLDAAAEETLLTLTSEEQDVEASGSRRLLLTAHKEDGGAVLEFLAATGEDNLQDRLALLAEESGEVPVERELSLRLLRHLASSVRHEQYHDTDIVTVHVNALEGPGGRP